MSQSQETLRPPPTEVGVWGWLRKNLFSSWANTILTVGAASVVFVVLRRVLVWVIRDARWEVVTTNIKVFLIGRYPADQSWRVIVGVAIVVALALLTWMFRRSQKAIKWLVVSWILSFPTIGVLLQGFSRDSRVLPQVAPDVWSGLLLTLVLAIVGIAASFPIGVLLALGRRSKLPIVKVLCTVYIEAIRGIPLISVLFMSQLLLPLFLPPAVRIGTVVRAMTGMTLFSAAYTAENIRGGLAAVPAGQYEAATALGLNKLLMMVFIILPQALRNVIPAIVGQFISLFKDTTLVVIVGLLDVLGIAKAVTGQRQFIGLHMEVYCFAALLFFICCYSLSRGSQRLEKALGVGER